MDFSNSDRNIFVEINHYKGVGGSILAIDGDSLAAFEVERSGLLQDLIATGGSAEIPIHQKAFALYQQFQNASVHRMDDLSGVIQVLAIPFRCLSHLCAPWSVRATGSGKYPCYPLR